LLIRSCPLSTEADLQRFGFAGNKSEIKNNFKSIIINSSCTFEDTESALRNTRSAFFHKQIFDLRSIMLKKKITHVFHYFHTRRRTHSLTEFSFLGLIKRRAPFSPVFTNGLTKSQRLISKGSSIPKKKKKKKKKNALRPSSWLRTSEAIHLESSNSCSSRSPLPIADRGFNVPISSG